MIWIIFHIAVKERKIALSHVKLPSSILIHGGRPKIIFFFRFSQKNCRTDFDKTLYRKNFTQYETTIRIDGERSKT